MEILQLPAKNLPVTTSLLRAVFGAHSVPVWTRLKAEMPLEEMHVEAGMLGLDYVKLVIAGGTKLPVLTLVGPEGCGKRTFFWWMHQVLGIPVKWCTNLDEISRSVEHRGLVVFSGMVTDKVTRLLDIVNTCDRFTLTPPLVTKKRVMEVHARWGLCAESDQDLDQMSQHEPWVRHMAPGFVETQFTMRDLLHEGQAMRPLVKQLPLLTHAQSFHWFAPDLIATPTSN